MSAQSRSVHMVVSHHDLSSARHFGTLPSSSSSMSVSQSTAGSDAPSSTVASPPSQPIVPPPVPSTTHTTTKAAAPSTAPAQRKRKAKPPKSKGSSKRPKPSLLAELEMSSDEESDKESLSLDAPEHFDIPEPDLPISTPPSFPPHSSIPVSASDPSLRIVQSFYRGDVENLVLADGRIVTRNEHDQLIQIGKNSDFWASMSMEFGGAALVEGLNGGDGSLSSNGLGLEQSARGLGGEMESRGERATAGTWCVANTRFGFTRADHDFASLPFVPNDVTSFVVGSGSTEVLLSSQNTSTSTFETLLSSTGTPDGTSCFPSSSSLPLSLSSADELSSSSSDFQSSTLQGSISPPISFEAFSRSPAAYPAAPSASNPVVRPGNRSWLSGGLATPSTEPPSVSSQRDIAASSRPDASAHSLPIAPHVNEISSSLDHAFSLIGQGTIGQLGGSSAIDYSRKKSTSLADVQSDSLPDWMKLFFEYFSTKLRGKEEDVLLLDWIGLESELHGFTVRGYRAFS